MRENIYILCQILLRALLARNRSQSQLLAALAVELCHLKIAPCGKIGGVGTIKLWLLLVPAPLIDLV